MFIGRISIGLIVLIWSTLSFAQKGNPKKRFIVTFKEQAESLSAQSFSVSESTKEVVFAESKEVVLESFDNVKSVDEDIFLTVDSTANDSRYDEQWALGLAQGAIEIEEAWDMTKGDASVVVAVIDTGILAHEDLSSKVLPGYDFISDSNISRDGNGRDSDPTDEGDYLNPSDSCSNGSFKSSSWHGTHVSGIIAAKSNNGIGVAGVNWNSKILPVRALGKCGGLTSDIADAVKWAAGVSVSGVPANANPANVINLSLGGSGPCTSVMQDAINSARAKGAVVVVAAGNNSDNLDVNPYTPANCQGVIVVGSNNQLGQKSYFSNYGSSVDLLAPGGGTGGSILSLGNQGSTTATFDTYSYQSGTSMAAPFVSGVASLILSVNKGLFPDQVEKILQDTTSSFATGSNCTDGCGSGILNARLAIIEALETTPDETYSETDPLSAGGGEESKVLNVSEDKKGGICGTIDTSGGNGGGKGPLSMVLFVVLGLIIQMKKSSKLIGGE